MQHVKVKVLQVTDPNLVITYCNLMPVYYNYSTYHLLSMACISQEGDWYVAEFDIDDSYMDKVPGVYMASSPLIIEWVGLINSNANPQILSIRDQMNSISPINALITKYNEGDRVKVRSDLKRGQQYGAAIYRGNMSFPSVVTIRKPYNTGGAIWYTIDENGWSITDEMIEGFCGSTNSPKNTDNGNIVCTCSSRDLFNYGCRCGAFKKEMELKNRK